MDHVAIMKKSLKLIPKILNGEKTIESRWSVHKIAPWNRVSRGDVVYFKNCSMPVTAKALVAKVLQYEALGSVKVNEIVEKYGGVGKICLTDPKTLQDFARNKRYCVLIFLKDPATLKPFNINKSGFGNACAWLCVDNIRRVKILT